MLDFKDIESRINDPVVSRIIHQSTKEKPIEYYYIDNHLYLLLSDGFKKIDYLSILKKKATEDSEKKIKEVYREYLKSFLNYN